jgi:hypothetical protein
MTAKKKFHLLRFILPLCFFSLISFDTFSSSKIAGPVQETWEVDIETVQTKSWILSEASAGDRSRESDNLSASLKVHLEVYYIPGTDRLFLCQFSDGSQNTMVPHFFCSGAFLELDSVYNKKAGNSRDEYVTTVKNAGDFVLKYVNINIISKTEYSFDINATANCSQVTKGVHPDPSRPGKPEPYDETPDFSERSTGMGSGTNGNPPNTDCKLSQDPDGSFLIVYSSSEPIYKFGSDNPDKTVCGSETSSGTIRIYKTK